MINTLNSDVRFLLEDQRLCKSPKLQSFFKSDKGQKMAAHLGWFRETDGLHVIRFENELWFVTLGWLANGKENGFAGVRVKEAASLGCKAETGYPSWQKGGDYEIVTRWFWDKYKDGGIIAIPEIWSFATAKQLKHAEVHTV